VINSLNNNMIFCKCAYVCAFMGCRCCIYVCA